MIGGIDLLRLFHWPVIQPQNDVAVVSISVIKIWPGNGNRFVCVVGEDREGTGGIEADTANRGLVNAVLVYGTSDRRAYTAPDICCRLFLASSDCGVLLLCRRDDAYIIPRLWLPQGNVFRSQPYYIALIIHDASSGASGAYIDTDIMLDMRSEFITGTGRHGSKFTQQRRQKHQF